MDARSPHARLPFTNALCVSMALVVAVAFTATMGASPSLTRDASVFDPLLVESSGAVLLEHETAGIPPVDREYEFPDDFRLDAPFSIELRKKESVLVPLAPIHDKLFSTEDATKVAIGFELNTCSGKVLTYVAMKNGSFHRFSSAMYQCATLVNVREEEQQHLDLCPVVHADRGIALRLDPLQVKGFLLRAKDDADVVALLRSTKAAGAYQHAFYVDSPGPSPFRVVNVTYSTSSTLLSFDLARTWMPSASSDPSPGPVVVCDGCEYALYAEMVPALNASDAPEVLRPPPPYCVGQNAEVKYTVPVKTSSGSATQHVTLPRGFADQFSTSGDYRFVLIASLPASVNNGHPAMLSFTPTRVSVTAPSHFVSRFLVALGVLAVIALLFFVAVKSALPQRLLGTQGSADKPALDDDESVRLLAQAIADQEAQDAQDLERYSRSGHDSDEETKEGDGGRSSESLLDVIRKSKSQQATPVSSPRKAPPVHLEGYHEIN